MGGTTKTTLIDTCNCQMCNAQIKRVYEIYDGYVWCSEKCDLCGYKTTYRPTKRQLESLPKYVKTVLAKLLDDLNSEDKYVYKMINKLL